MLHDRAYSRSGRCIHCPCCPSYKNFALPIACFIAAQDCKAYHCLTVLVTACSTLRVPNSQLGWCRDDLLKAVEEHQVIIIVGETGSGKTTQIPQVRGEGQATRLCPHPSPNSKSPPPVGCQGRPWRILTCAFLEVSTETACLH